MSLKAFQFGAGNIGRGFVGQLFFESGYHTVFLDVMQDVVDGLNTRGCYPLRIVGDECSTMTISNVSAVQSRDMDAAARVIAESDLGATAVGVPILPRIAPVLAAGIALRFQEPTAAPLNIILCENLIGAGSYMREQVRGHLPESLHGVLDEKVGFVEASIGRMVPVMTAEQKAEDPLLVCVEPYCELPVDRNGFKGAIPVISHMKAMDTFKAYVERKLYVHNMSHAVAAYLGHLRGYEYIWQAVADPEIRRITRAAQKETCAALVARYGLDMAALDAHAEDLLHRYTNKALSDQVARIGKDPIRKLSNNDRLIGAGLACLEEGVEPEHVAQGAAAALLFERADDEASLKIQALRREKGLGAVFQEVCGIAPDSKLAQLITREVERLQIQMG